MKIALPFSQHFHAVSAALLPLSGALSVRSPDFFLKGGVRRGPFTAKEILFHANGFIDDGFDAMMTGVFLKALNTYASLVSFDLGPSARIVKTGANGYSAESPVLSERQIVVSAKRKLTFLRRYYKGVISVENLDYHDSGAYELVCDPGFIRRFIREFDLSLTLDIGHAEVTSRHLGMDTGAYIRKMPLSAVREIHLSRASGLRDAHQLPSAQEYELLDLILEAARSSYVVIEYYRHPRGIIAANQKLMRFLKKRNRYEN